MRSYVILKDKRQVIGIDHYGGKSIRAIAKCAEGDTFSETIGKELVDARLNYTIAKKDVKRCTINCINVKPRLISLLSNIIFLLNMLLKESLKNNMLMMSFLLLKK